MALSWWRNAVNRFTKNVTRGRGRTKRSLPLWVEMFEDRVLLSGTTLQWTPAGVNTNWNNPTNWTTAGHDAFPLAGDIAQFTGCFFRKQRCGHNQRASGREHLPDRSCHRRYLEFDEYVGTRECLCGH